MSDELKDISLNDIVVVSNTRSDFEGKEFDELPPEIKNPLKELAASIKTNGVVQAITVKRMPDGKYRLICGERRYRASLLAGKSDIPAIIKDIPDEKILQTQIIENLQRKGVSAMDDIRGIVSLRDDEGMTPEEIAKAVGKSLSHVTAQLLISKAEPEVLDALGKNQITRGVALKIAALTSPDSQTKAAAALKRDKKAYLVKAHEADLWIASNFGAEPKRAKFGGRNQENKSEVGKYAADWKYYLLRFSPEQFLVFQRIVRRQKQFTVWASAVEKVMVSSENAENGGGRCL